MRRFLIIPLILSLTVSISACGKTTSEKAAEKAQEELGLSDDEAAELKEVYDDVLEEDTADTTAESETESSEEVKELKSYELKDEVKNADASELLFQVDDIVLKLDGSMTFHDVINAFENNEEDYIWKEYDDDKVAYNEIEKIEDAESTLMGANNQRIFKVCKVISEDSDALEIAQLYFLNATNDAIESSSSSLAGIKTPDRSEGFSYYFWFPGGISLTDTSDLTWDNAEDVLEKAGYIKTVEPRYADGETMSYIQANDNDVPAYYYKDSQNLCYFVWLHSQYRIEMTFHPMDFIIDFSEKAADKGFGSPLIENKM